VRVELSLEREDVELLAKLCLDAGRLMPSARSDERHHLFRLSGRLQYAAGEEHKPDGFVNMADVLEMSARAQRGKAI